MIYVLPWCAAAVLAWFGKYDIALAVFAFGCGACVALLLVAARLASERT